MLAETVSLSRDFVEELGKSYRKIRTLFDARIKMRGLTLSRARLLLLLAKEDGMTQSQLAGALDMEQPSIVGLVDALEDTGFVARCAVEGDRRAKGVCLTPSARVKVRELEGFAAHVREEALKGVSSRDLAVALKVLRQMTANIEAQA
jgi:MarR family transcriptional regulator for hemolysin